MEHKLTVTVPEDVYQTLAEEALKQGRAMYIKDADGNSIRFTQEL